MILRGHYSFAIKKITICNLLILFKLLIILTFCNLPHLPDLIKFIAIVLN